MGPDYHPFLELHSETFSNLESNVEEALEKLENYLMENGALKQQLKKYVAAEKVVSELKPQLEENKMKSRNCRLKLVIKQKKRRSYMISLAKALKILKKQEQPISA